MRRGARVSLVALFAVIGLAVAWVLVPGRAETPMAVLVPAPEPPPPPPPPKPGPPVLAVKVDNVAQARPPVGVRAADAVYVEPVEAGLSRLIAVFGRHRPPVVGPVRSARETDLRLLPQLGGPTLGFSGAAPEILPMVDASPLIDASPERVPEAYFRDNARPSPHNLMVRPDQLPPGGRWSPRARLSFGPPPAGGVPAGHREVRYERASIGFDWAPRQRRWLVSMDGAPFRDGRGSFGASTVVLQTVPVSQSAFSDSLGNASPLVHSVGGGRAVVLRDGRAFEATWSRPAPDAPTTYRTPDGERIDFAPGQVWTVFVPQGG